MKLLFSGNSPYARRIRLAVRQFDLLDKVEEIDINPREEHLERLLRDAPGGKVPVLVTDAGNSVCESLSIAHYLNSISAKPLYPKDQSEFEKTLEIESFASCLMDSLFTRSRENRRVSEEQSPGLIEIESGRAAQLYDALESRASGLDGLSTMAEVTTFVALDYADFRHGDDAWRKGRGNLEKWWESVSKIDWVQASKPG